MQELVAWKRRPDRKPLLLMGARQVGKTFLLKKFGQEQYENTVYLNFEGEPRLCKLFEATLEPAQLLKALSIELEREIVPGKTLLIFDEVQESPEALNSLKYFFEEAPEQHIAAAGSLLGVQLVHQRGFPVGKVQFLHLYPLSFLEFLEALGRERLRQFVEEISGLGPLPEPFHEELMAHFKEYLVVGGMPEAVVKYVASGDVAEARLIQEAILAAYHLDFAKHAPKEQMMKINQVWSSIPDQLAKENRKFIYSALRQGGRAREFEGALQWLIEAGLVLKTRLVKVPRIPFSTYVDGSAFKIYLMDVGLLGAMARLPPKVVLHDHELFQEFRGALIENAVAEQLVQSGYPLFYWASPGKAELDFLIEHEGALLPLEVKSGHSSKKQSLRVYAENYHPELLVRASPMNLKKDGQLLNCPLYLLGKLRSLLQLQSLEP